MEWFLPEPSVDVRQGDLLLSRDPQTGAVEEICVVITADCDISKGKFGRQLACLRIIRHSDYLRHVWAARKLDKAVKDERRKLRSQLAKWHAAQLGNDSTLSEEAALMWIRRSEPEAICEALGVLADDKRKLTAALKAFSSAFGELDKNADSMAMYSAFRAAISGTELLDARRQALQQATQESLPEDIFLLPALPLAQETPCVVMLREVVGIPYDAVCYRTVDADTADKFLRIGRLEPTFKYAVSQAFGALYSKIGLPADYERRCKDVATSVSNYDWEN